MRESCWLSSLSLCIVLRDGFCYLKWNINYCVVFSIISLNVKKHNYKGNPCQNFQFCSHTGPRFPFFEAFFVAAPPSNKEERGENFWENIGSVVGWYFGRYIWGLPNNYYLANSDWMMMMMIMMPLHCITMSWWWWWWLWWWWWWWRWWWWWWWWWWCHCTAKQLLTIFFTIFRLYLYLYLCIFVFVPKSLNWWWIHAIQWPHPYSEQPMCILCIFLTGQPCKDRLILTAIFKRKTHRHLLYHLMMMMHFCIFAFFVFLYFLYFCIFCIFVFLYFFKKNFANQTPLLLSKPMTASTFGANDVFLATAPTGVFNREHR